MNIEVRNIHKRFGTVHANNGISVTFREGRIIGILGENGAGKSTLMKILCGFQSADEGQILIDDKAFDFTGPTAAINHGIGMLQQDPLDIGAFTVLENFIYGSSGSLVPDTKTAKNILNAYIERFGFQLDKDDLIDNLSIAQRQQLEIIRLLALGVKTLILDEPTTGISPEQKTILFDALRKLARDEGMIVLIVSHKLEDVIDLCDEVIVLRAGRLVGDMLMPDSESLTRPVTIRTKKELVVLMFGSALAPQSRDSVKLGAPVFIADKLHLHDGRLDIRDFSLEIKAGEVIGFAGLDGSGQELVMRACAGLHPVRSGTISVNGNLITSSRKRQSYRGNIIQSLIHPLFATRDEAYLRYMQAGVFFAAAGRIEEGLIAGLTLHEHMAMVMSDNRNIDWQSARLHAEAQIKRYQVRGRVESYVEELSGGNQQRVLMGLLPEKASLLILQQPTRGLDVDSARHIWSHLLERRHAGTAILFDSAELDELVTYSDRIFAFHAGHFYEVPDVSKTNMDELGHLIGGSFEQTEHH
jgi:general nucleoside transport system ATP-binding protein